MHKIVISLLLIITAMPVFSQSQSVPRLIDMLGWTPRRVDTTLKKDGFRLMQRDVDSTSSLYQYSWFDKLDDGRAIVRSLILMDATVRNMQSRLLTYRTYYKEEYQDIAAWLLRNNYQATEKYDFKEEQHVVYSNGKQAIRIKTISNVVKSGKNFVAYELELGR